MSLSVSSLGPLPLCWGGNKSLFSPLFPQRVRKCPHRVVNRTFFMIFEHKFSDKARQGGDPWIV